MRPKSILLVVLIAVLGLIVFVGGIVGVAIYATSGVVDGGNRFLALVGEGKSGEAYRECAAATLKQKLDEAGFAEAVRSAGLTEHASASWTSRSLENSVGRLEGTVKTRSGGTIPLSMDLVKENGQWKVVSWSGPGAPAIPAATATPAVPAPAELNKLVARTLLNFNQALQSRDFGSFHAACAGPFQRQHTPADLLKIFDGFIQAKIDLAEIAQLEPAFDPPPSINVDGVLVVKGHYPTRPGVVHFELKYLQEGGVWRPLGVNINVKPLE